MTAEEKLIELLAHVYARIPFARLRLKSVHDVWNHRVRAAATRATLSEAISRLANFFGIQSLPPEAIVLIDELAPHEHEHLEMLIRDHIKLSMKAAIRGKQIKEERKKARKNKKKL